MLKKRIMMMVLLCILVICATAESYAISFQKTKDTLSIGPELKVTTDKLIYSIGEEVTVYLTNIGDELLCGGGPIITIFDSENNIVYQEAVYCYWELEPGEFIEWIPWDQTNQQGHQVPVGAYIAEGMLSGGNDNYVDSTQFFIFNLHSNNHLSLKHIVIP